mgnify:CR=1 FL=1
MYTAPDCAACAALQASGRQYRGSRGPPLAFSWGFKGAILSRERMAPLLRTLARCGRTKDAAPSGCPPSAPAGCPKPRSRAYVASAEPRSALKSGRNALHSHPSSQRRRTLSPSFTSKVKTTASSVCAPFCLRQRQAGGQDGDVLPLPAFFLGKIFSQRQARMLLHALPPRFFIWGSLCRRGQSGAARENAGAALY